MTDSVQHQSVETAVDLNTILAEVRDQYSNELAEAVHAGLGVIASLSLQQRDHCLVMIYEGGPGAGKSVTVRMLTPDRPDTKKLLERVDNFTSASFVSHAANRSQEELKTIDLLPRIKGKVMLTKELSQLFSNEDTTLRQSFGTLTSVLDGNGLITNSGSQGERGYEGDYRFNWIGATTPIPSRTHDLMAQLGNRILFYELPSRESSEDDLLATLTNNTVGTDVDLLRGRVNDLIAGHFRLHPESSVDPANIAFPERLKLLLIRYARLIVNGRVAIFKSATGEYEASAKEGAERVMFLLNTLVFGLALIAGRNHVTEDDLKIIKHVALSSLPQKRRNLLQLVLSAGGEITSTVFAKSANISKPTALERMKELAATGICMLKAGNQQTSTAATITLAEEWRWLLSDSASPPFKGFQSVRIGEEKERKEESRKNRDGSRPQGGFALKGPPHEFYPSCQYSLIEGLSFSETEKTPQVIRRREKPRVLKGR